MGETTGNREKYIEVISRGKNGSGKHAAIANKPREYSENNELCFCF